MKSIALMLGHKQPQQTHLSRPCCCLSPDIAAVSDKDQLQRSYDSLHNNHSQLQQEVLLLHRQISGLCCPEGWTRFGCSCYYKDSQRKKWEDSRTDCQSRAADLVVINSREEQEFVRGLNEPGAFWIGLKAEYTHKTTGWEPNWEWVDGSPLTLRFWETGHSQKTWFHYAECCNKQGKWTQSRYFNSNNWICGSVNVRYSRGDNTDGGETEVEIQVEISENEDTLNGRQTDRGSHEVRPLGRTSCLSAVFRRRLTPARAVAALCLLMMAGIFTRCENLFFTLLPV
ncbi:CD209 antigen-like protein 2 [Chaetodon auriga]|uniref:CD209 antigen-like protein 2 n=1 Tax=Chaetodon auriga TaxID=39042 RepID=UPI004032E8F1